MERDVDTAIGRHSAGMRYVGDAFVGHPVIRLSAEVWPLVERYKPPEANVTGRLHRSVEVAEDFAGKVEVAID